jgi:uncharacterized protein (DUF58 family)
MLERVLQYSQIYNFYNWVFKQHAPERGVVFLSQRRVYILPTRHGFSFSLAIVLMLFGSINYGLSLGYMLTFLLAGLGIVSLLHTFRNLAHLYVSAARVDNVFAGDTARFVLALESRSDIHRFAIDLFVRGGHGSTCNIPPRQTASVSVPVRTQARGWLQLPRVTMETRYPLGFARAWSYVQPDMRALVYPRPDNSGLPASQPIAERGDVQAAGAGLDDFAGLRPYQASDSPRHIAWKAAARGGPMLTKIFSGRAAMELWLDWTALPAAMDTEARLSRLTRWVLLAHELDARYGLKLPGLALEPAQGEEHKERCLRELALFGLPGEAR